MSSRAIQADGSAPTDAHETVEVDRDAEPYRWVCPRGHTSWDATNSHIWCQSCRRAVEAGADIQAEHWELYDRRAERVVPFSAVELV